MPELDVSRVINGTYGEVWMDGKWLSNFNHLEANVEIQKAELKISGNRWTKRKVTGLNGTGTISGFKVTSDLIQLNTPMADSANPAVRTEIISKLADPEAYGYERIRLKYVLFDRIQLANWTAGETVNEEWPFTFEGYELLDPIAQS